MDTIHNFNLTNHCQWENFYTNFGSAQVKSQVQNNIVFIFIDRFGTIISHQKHGWNSWIIIINKPGKNKFILVGHSPTLMFNTPYKLFGKIINIRLTWCIEKINYSTLEQNGFCNNKETFKQLSTKNSHRNTKRIFLQKY